MKYEKILQLSFCICGLILLFSSFVSAQKAAILTPSKNPQTERFAKAFRISLTEHINVLDLSLADSVLKTREFERPFNLTTQDGKNLGITIGCNFFVVLKTESLRRSTFERTKFYESYVTLYLVSSRTGRLVFWKHLSFEEDTQKQAKAKLFASTDQIALEISEQIKHIGKIELNVNEKPVTEFAEVDSSETEDLRPPLPYKRIKPEYTKLAALYNVIATVDALVDIDEEGRVLRIEIVRWAGFGLDESVTKTINKMNWRPADLNGKTMPMRILLRYNFRNIETDQ